MEKNKNVIDLATIDPKSLPELADWKDKQIEIVKENPFIKIEDAETYAIAKKHRTALVTARTSIEKQDKLIATKIKEFRSRVLGASQELIDITLPHEQKQQEEVKRYEAEKEAERERKREAERQRVQVISDKIESIKGNLEKMISGLKHEEISKFPDVILLFSQHVVKEQGDFDFQEFYELFSDMIDEKQKQFFDRCNVLKKEEEQRLENERLAKIVQENERKAKLQSERTALIKEHIGHGPDFEIDQLAEMSEEEFKKLLSEKRLAHSKAIEETEKREQQERQRQQKLQEEEDRIAKEKEQLRLQKEAENKMAQRTKRITDEFGMKFNFVDAFVKDGWEPVSVDFVKNSSDEEFENYMGGLGFPENSENPFKDQPAETFEGREDIGEPSKFEKAIMDLEVDFENIEKKEEINALSLVRAEEVIDFFKSRSGFDRLFDSLDNQVYEEIEWELSKIIDEWL